MTCPGIGAFFVHLQDTRLWATQDYYKWRSSRSCPRRGPLSATSPISQAINRPCCALRPHSTSLPYGKSVVRVGPLFLLSLFPPALVSSPNALDEEPSENRRTLSPRLYELMGGMPTPRVQLPHLQKKIDSGLAVKALSVRETVCVPPISDPGLLCPLASHFPSLR